MSDESELAQDHLQFHVQLANRQKSIAVAYTLLLFLGLFGAHHKYLGNEDLVRQYRTEFLVPGTLACIWLLWQVAVLVHPELSDQLAASQLFMDIVLVLSMWQMVSLILLVLLAVQLARDCFQLPKLLASYNARVSQEITAACSHV